MPIKPKHATATDAYYKSLDDELRCSDAGRRFANTETMIMTSDQRFWQDPAWGAEADTSTLGEAD